MLTKRDRNAQYKAIETLRETRIKNLRQLASGFGSWAELGRQAGYSASFLTALAGPNPRRSIGEKLAREIETALRLATGWLDKSH